MGEAPACLRRALGQPDQSLPGTGRGCRTGGFRTGDTRTTDGPTSALVRTSVVSPCPGPPPTVTRTSAPGACLRALVSPSWTIRYAVRPSAAGTSSGASTRRSTRMPARTESATRRGHVGQRRLGQLTDRRAEYADDLPQVLQRLMRTLPDHRGRPGDLLGGRVRPVLQRARVHAQQRQPVPEHVVDLPRDLLPGEVLGLFEPQPGLGLGADRPVHPAAASCRRCRTN